MNLTEQFEKCGQLANELSKKLTEVKDLESQHKSASELESSYADMDEIKVHLDNEWRIFRKIRG